MAVSTGRFERAKTNGLIVTPISMTSTWTTMRSGLSSSDNSDSVITNPTAQITSSTARIRSRNGAAGTILRLRMARQNLFSISGTLTVNVFGRTGDDAWQLLPNKAGTTSVAIPTATDVTTSLATPNAYGATDPDVLAWDCDGCDEILIGIETALTGSGANLAQIQGKMI